MKIPTDTFYQSKVRPFLFSLRNKIQPIINEWSEEDLHKIENALFGTYAVDVATRLLNKLKSLKPQNHWRPTGAQLASLEIACDRNDRIGFDLTELLKGLKKYGGYSMLSQWKPSEGQMESITCAVRKMKESACYDSELVSLLNDLKKL